MLRFLQPDDWQTTGRSPDLLLSCDDPATPRRVRVVRRDDWVAAADRAPVVCATETRAVGVGDLLTARIGPLEAGTYVCSVDDPSGPALRGLVVDPAHDAWEDRFAQMLAARVQRYRRQAHGDAAPSDPASEPAFSITTTVYDTEPLYLRELHATIAAQTFRHFEWLILDNGSTRDDTRGALQQIADSDPRFRSWRVANNIHIVPGNRFLLERARGRAIVPVDSDDLLTEDALAILAEHERAEPTIRFTEEHKVSLLGRPLEYVWRPAWSRLHALATCPAAHLMAFPRKPALALDVYGDDYARGCHDWDTFLRLTDAGVKAERIQQVCYGWRVHPGSSAMSSDAKDYLATSQLETVRRSLARRELASRFDIAHVDIPALGYYHATRRPKKQAERIEVRFCVRNNDTATVQNVVHNLQTIEYPAAVVVVATVGVELPTAARERITKAARLRGCTLEWEHRRSSIEFCEQLTPRPDSTCMFLIDASIRCVDGAWIEDVLGTLELAPEVGIVGGKLTTPDGATLHAGFVAGLEGFAASPRFGQHPDAVWGGGAHIRRHVLGVYGGFMAIRCDTLRAIGAPLDLDSDDGIHGLEYCMRARRTRRIETAFSPRFAGHRSAGMRAEVGLGHGLRALLAADAAAELALDAYYSPLLSKLGARYGQLDAPPSPHTSPTIVPSRGLLAPWYGRALKARRVAGRWARTVLGGWRTTPGAAANASAGAASTSALRRVGRSVAGQWEPPPGLFGMAEPLHLEVDAARADTPFLNVLVPGLAMRCMSGGPNTILNLVYRMAAQGVPVRLIATGVGADPDPEPLWRHMMSLSGIHERFAHVEIVDGSDRSRAVIIGPDDVFMATAWWTAQMVKYALPRTRHAKFLYLIQDFEPVLHEHSTAHALALETYGLDFVPIVNHRFLLAFLSQQRIGRFADPAFAARCAVIDPAIDRERFHFVAKEPRAVRRLLFYARPVTGKRNMFELGVAALQLAIDRAVFDGELGWEFYGMGDEFEPVPLGHGRVLQQAPWRDFDGYAEQMRGADVLLSLMLSPHPSYPPLEMAAAGGLVVTNTYANKTAAEFAALSGNILAAAPTVEALADRLAEAVRQSADLASRERHSAIDAPKSWDDALAPIVPYAVDAWQQCRRNR